jgi:general secretion pathway protein G
MRVWVDNRDGRGPRTEDRGRKVAGNAVICPPPSLRRGRGFTLIELMLVLVILATLSAIVVPKFAKQSTRAKVVAAHTQIADFGTALDAFEVACGRYPTTTEGLYALLQAPADAADVWQGPYLSRNTIPLDPWGGEYQYRSPGQYNPDGYDVCSFGPDGRQGGDDDITNWSEEVR